MLFGFEILGVSPNHSWQQIYSKPYFKHMLGLGQKNTFVLYPNTVGCKRCKIAKYEIPFLTCAGCSGEARITGDSQPENSFKLHAARPETFVCLNWPLNGMYLAVVSLALFFLLPPFQGAESSDMGCSSSSSSSSTWLPTREWGSLACRIHASLSAS